MDKVNMAYLVIVHKNTETKKVDLGDNDKIAWMLLHKKDNSIQKFFAELSKEEQKRLWDEKHKRDMKLRNRSYAEAEKLIEQSPLEELKWLLTEIWDYNARMWLDNDEMDDTIGQETVLESGFTTNQNRWIRKVLEQICQTDGGYCNDCKYATLLQAPDNNQVIGGSCNHPEFVKKVLITTFSGVPKTKPTWCHGKEPIETK